MRKRKRAKEQDAGEVSLIPIMNLVCLLIPFLLYTASFVVFSTVNVRSPQFVRPTVGPPEPIDENLNLMLVITDEGFRLRSATVAALPSSCGHNGAVADRSTPDIPLSEDGQVCRDGRGYPSVAQRRERQVLHLGPPSCAYDFEQLNQCIQDIKTEYPEETSIVISGESDVDYDVLIQAMDATRGTPESPLFDEVTLSAGVA